MKIFVVILVFIPLAFSEEVVILNSHVTKTTPLLLNCGDTKALQDNDTIEWVYTNSTGYNETRKGYNPTVNITSNTATGRYVCYVNDEEVASYLAAKITTAVIQNTRKSVTYSDGDKNRKLTCIAKDSYPNPEFIWMRRGDLENEAPILVTADRFPNFNINTTGDKSVLMFYNVTYTDEAHYICSVKNEAGNTTVEVQVRVKDKYAAVWPFLGIVIEVVVLIAVIFLYEKRSKKNTDDDDNVVIQAEDEKPLRSDDGTEVRNRNGKK